MTKSRLRRAGLGPIPTPEPTEVPTGMRASVLDAIHKSSGGVGIEALAEALSLHPNSVRTHVAALVDAGLVDPAIEAPTGPGRPAHRFVASVAAEAMLAIEHAGSRGGGAEYRALAEAFARHLRTRREAKAEARAVGELWGAEVVAGRPRPRSGVSVRQSILALLADLGFAPTEAPAQESARLARSLSSKRSGADVAFLRACPLLEAARDNPDVICSVHLGLVVGARRALGASEGTVGLEPFAQPGACRLTLPA